VGGRSDGRTISRIPRLLVVVECAVGELGDTDKGILSAANRINGLLGGTWEAAVVPGESVAEAGPSPLWRP